MSRTTIKKTLTVVGITTLLLTIAFPFLLLTAILTLKKTSPEEVAPKYEEETLEKGKDGQIVVIPLHGIIGFSQPNPLGESLVEDIKLALQQAADDPKTKAIILDTDSPGGEITASDTIYNALKTFPGDKPVIVYFNSIGASGAYYAACGADWIMCSPTTLTGSIGVIISTLNYRELFGKIGLESLIFKSGKFKDMLNGSRAITPEEREYVESLVMQSYDKFLNIVAEARKLSPNRLKNGPADGRILSGTDAKREKLVDQLGYIEDAYEKARELGDAPQAKIVRYTPQKNLGQIFKFLGSKAKVQESLTQKIELQLPWDTHKLKPGQLYLIPPFLAP